MSPLPPSHARAFAFGLAGVALFSAMDAVIKHLSVLEHTLVVALGRYLCALPFATLVWMRAGRPRVTSEMWRAHAIRGIVIAASSSLFFWAVSVMPLAEAIMLSFIAPLLIPFFAAVLLKERLRWINVVATFAGFAGALIALLGGQQAAAADGRDPELYGLGIVAMLVFSAGYALAMVLMRARAGRDGSAIFGVLGTLIPGALIAGPAVAFGEVPALASLPAFLLMGILATISLWALSEAYARAEAQALAPLEFTALPWAALFGYMFFAETPRIELWLGAAVIVAACLWSSWATARAGVEPPPHVVP